MKYRRSLPRAASFGMKQVSTTTRQMPGARLQMTQFSDPDSLGLHVDIKYWGVGLVYAV